jgi:hypothetical protein
MPDPAIARTWLDAERACLVATTAYTAVHGWPSHATRLAATVFHYLDAGAYHPETITTSRPCPSSVRSVTRPARLAR